MWVITGEAWGWFWGLSLLLIIISGIIRATLNNWRKMMFENRLYWRKWIAILQLDSSSSHIRIDSLCRCLFGSHYLWTAFDEIASSLAAASADYFAWICSSVMFSGMHDFVKDLDIACNFFFQFLDSSDWVGLINICPGKVCTRKFWAALFKISKN